MTTVIDSEVLDAVKKMRDEWSRNDSKRDAGLPKSFPEVQRFDDISYGPNGDANLLDVYVPKHSETTVPTVINVHGGGFVYGDKELYQHYCLGWARNGFGVVNFNYRLGPENVFPTALQDTASAINWVVDHADDYNLDMNNVFITGDSAGTTMAYQYLVAHNSAKYRDALNIQTNGMNIRGAALNCGFYFLDRPGALENDDMLGMAYFTPAVRNKYPDILRTEDYMNDQFPPVFVMTANQDFLHDEGVRFDQYLLDHDYEHEFKIYGTDDNPRGHVFHIDQKDEIAHQCNQDEKEFFEKLID